MKNSIAWKNLELLQKVIDSKKFLMGKKIYLNGSLRKNGIVPGRIEKIYSNISKAKLGQKTFHSALCKSIEILCVAQFKKKFMRKEEHQNIYDELVNTYSKNFNLEVGKSVLSISDYINRVYPNVGKTNNSFFKRKTPPEIEKMRKLINCITETRPSKEQCWVNLKAVLVLAYDGAKKRGITKQDKTFFKKLNRFLVFKDPPKNSLRLLREKNEVEMITEEVKRSVKRNRSNIENPKAIYGEDGQKEKSLDLC